MTKFVVFFINLTEEQRKSLVGWNNPVGQAYLDASYAFTARNYNAAFELGMITPAALVEGNSIEATFSKLQNLDDEWTKNPGVTCLTDFPRSSSVGDIVLNLDTNEFFFCASIGFDPLTDAQASPVVRSHLRVMAWQAAATVDAGTKTC